MANTIALQAIVSGSKPERSTNSLLAQTEERLSYIQDVTGSIPVETTILLCSVMVSITHFD